jgi:hypothetical protein
VFRAFSMVFSELGTLRAHTQNEKGRLSERPTEFGTGYIRGNRMRNGQRGNRTPDTRIFRASAIHSSRSVLSD